MKNWLGTHGTFHERKAQRIEFNKKHVYGWKLRPCTACAGSGHYDSNGSPPCGACDGSGKERYKPEAGTPLDPATVTRKISN